MSSDPTTLTSEERTVLEARAHRLRDVLTRYFSDEEAADPSLVAAVDEVDVVVDPMPGLIIRLRHWSAPEGKMLNILLPAFGPSGLLGHHEWDPDPSHYTIFPFAHLREKLSSNCFEGKWVDGPNGHLYAPLYGLAGEFRH